MTPVHFLHGDPLAGMVAGFVSQRIFGDADGFSQYAAMGVFRGAELIGGCVYHNWHPREGVVELSHAGDDALWLTRPVLRAMFDWPFKTLGARLIVLRVSERNLRARAIPKRFGFQEVIVPRLRGDGEAECIFTFSAADWAAHKLNR